MEGARENKIYRDNAQQKWCSVTYFMMMMVEYEGKRNSKFSKIYNLLDANEMLTPKDCDFKEHLQRRDVDGVLNN